MFAIQRFTLYYPTLTRPFGGTAVRNQALLVPHTQLLLEFSGLGLHHVMVSVKVPYLLRLPYAVSGTDAVQALYCLGLSYGMNVWR